MSGNNEETEETEDIRINELYMSDYKYKGLRLRNGMKVLLTSCENIKECEVVLNVQIGSFHDPPNIQGMAHLLEHVIARNMMCISESEFAKILYECGGFANATTFTENTTYYFKAPNIDGLLQMFAGFIFEPAFNTSVIEDEVKAIDSEHVILSTVDKWRLREFVYAQWRMSGLRYPVFDVGNKYTLSDNITSNELVIELGKFHDNFYSANIMSLCILARDSLDSLQTLVEDIFSTKPNKKIDIIPIQYRADILPQLTNDYKTAWYIVPTLPKKTLYIYFPLPLHDVNQLLYQPQPSNYICWMLRDRRQGSLLAALKDRNWCTFIDCYDEYDTIETIIGKIRLHLTLTQQGLHHVNDIITLTFQYLRLLLQVETRQNHYCVFRKNCLLPDSINFVNIAKEMSICPLSSILEHCSVKHTEFPQYAVNEILENYVVPENIMFCVMAKENRNITNKITQWRQTDYIEYEIRNDQILHWQSPNIIDNININEIKKEFRFLQNNDFEWNLMDNIRDDSSSDVSSTHLMNIRNNITSEKDDYPWKAHRNNFLRIWCSISCELQNFEMYFQFYSTCSVHKDTERNNYRNYNLNAMLVHLIQDYMSDYLYSAEMVGITISFKSNIYGIRLYIKNHVYKKELPEMIMNIIRKMINVLFTESTFQMLKEQYITSLKENMCASSYMRALYLLEIHLMKRLPYNELLEDATFISGTDMECYIVDFLKTMFVKCLIRGNLTDYELEIMNEHVEGGFQELSSRRKLKTDKLRDIKLEKGSYRLITERNSFHKSWCTMTYYQGDSSLLTDEGIQCSAFLHIIQLIIKGHCLEYLRMKKHLGYAIYTEVLQMYDTCGLAISVIGHNRQFDEQLIDTTYVQRVIKKFMENTLERVQNISENELKKYQNAAMSDRKNVHKMEMVDEFYSSNDYWQEIVSRNYNFLRSDHELEYMRRVTREEICTFFEKMLDEDSQRKFSIHILHP